MSPWKAYRALALAVAACGMGASLAEAAITVGGDAGEVFPDPTTWGSTTYAFIGVHSGKIGSLTYDGGSPLRAQECYIGCSSGSTGTATVTGSERSSSLIIGKLYLGDVGSGTLNVQDLGEVSCTSTYIGNAPGSIGTATVTGAGSTWTTTFLRAGYSGSGTLNIQDGGLAGATFGWLGYGSGSSGTVTVTGANSRFGVGDLVVGVDGSGTVNVQNGGIVTSGPDDAFAYIGMHSGATGTVTVTGANSKWQHVGPLVVGNYGNGTLNIESTLR